MLLEVVAVTPVTLERPALSPAAADGLVADGTDGIQAGDTIEAYAANHPACSCHAIKNRKKAR
jgi:hypothetical protein